MPCSACGGGGSSNSARGHFNMKGKMIKKQAPVVQKTITIRTPAEYQYYMQIMHQQRLAQKNRFQLRF